MSRPRRPFLQQETAPEVFLTVQTWPGAGPVGVRIIMVGEAAAEMARTEAMRILENCISMVGVLLKMWKLARECCFVDAGGMSRGDAGVDGE